MERVSYVKLMLRASYICLGSKSLIVLFCATWFISHVGSSAGWFFTILLFFGKTISHDKNSQISDNYDH